MLNTSENELSVQVIPFGEFHAEKQHPAFPSGFDSMRQSFG
jgi:hypothetical protein